MRTGLMIIAAASLTLGACATTQEAKIENGLVDLGLPQGLSSCMASRMVDNLSGSQLRRVAEFAASLDDDIDDMSLGEVADRFGALGDSEVVAVMARAAAGCAISG